MSRSNDAKEGNRGAPPVWSKRIWTGSAMIEVAIYRHFVQGTFQELAVYTTAAKRSWKDGDQQKESRSFRPEDLLPLGRLLGEAFDYVSDQRRE